MSGYLSAGWLTVLVGAAFFLPTSSSAVELSAMESLGKQIFFDENLSEPRGQSCASCHAPQTGFTSPSAFVNLLGAVERGAVMRRSGNRKPPTAACFSVPRLNNKIRGSK